MRSWERRARAWRLRVWCVRTNQEREGGGGDAGGACVDPPVMSLAISIRAPADAPPPSLEGGAGPAPSPPAMEAPHRPVLPAPTGPPMPPLPPVPLVLGPLILPPATPPPGVAPGLGLPAATPACPTTTAAGAAAAADDAEAATRKRPRDSDDEVLFVETRGGDSDRDDDRYHNHMRAPSRLSPPLPMYPSYCVAEGPPDAATPQAVLDLMWELVVDDFYWLVGGGRGYGEQWTELAGYAARDKRCNQEPSISTSWRYVCNVQ